MLDLTKNGGVEKVIVIVTIAIGLYLSFYLIFYALFDASYSSWSASSILYGYTLLVAFFIKVIHIEDIKKDKKRFHHAERN